jgi:hypothetical protein
MKNLSSVDKPTVLPECDPFETLVYRLCDKDMTRRDAIWSMKEEDVYMEAYQRRIDKINFEFSNLAI